MEGSFSGIAFSSSDSSGRFPTRSSRSSGGRSQVGKSNPRNSVFAWKVAFRGLLFQVVIVVVVFLLAVVVLVMVEVWLKSNPRNSVFAWKLAVRGLLFQVVTVVVVMPTSSSRSNGGST